MLRKLLHPMLALALTAGLAIAPVERADAGGRGVAAGVAAGIIGLAILGATSRQRAYGYEYDDYEPRCYRAPRRCYWDNRRCFENRYGDTVCRGGDYVCRRPMICD